MTPLEGLSQGSKRALPLGLPQDPPTNKGGAKLQGVLRGGGQSCRAPEGIGPLTFHLFGGRPCHWKHLNPEPACGCLTPHGALPFPSAQKRAFGNSLASGQMLLWASLSHCVALIRQLAWNCGHLPPLLPTAGHPALEGSGELPVVASRGRLPLAEHQPHPGVSGRGCVSAEAGGAFCPKPHWEPPTKTRKTKES